jgi:hypothetical protein
MFERAEREKERYGEERLSLVCLLKGRRRSLGQNQQLQLSPESPSKQ